MRLFNRKKKAENKDNLPKQLVDFVTHSNSSFTFYADNKDWMKFKILSNNSSGWDNPEYVTSQVKNYSVNFGNKQIKDFDKDEIFVFARIMTMGDNSDYLFTDKTNRIYHVNIGRGNDENTTIIAENISELIGDIKVNELESKDYHFDYVMQLVKASELVNENRIVIIDIHGFLIDQYESLLKELIEKNNVAISFQKFTYENVDWNDSSMTHYPVKILINNREFDLEIEKSKWFDFELTNKLNPILQELESDKTLHIIHEPEWDEQHAMIFLTLKEYLEFKKNRLIVGNENALQHRV